MLKRIGLAKEVSIKEFEEIENSIEVKSFSCMYGKTKIRHRTKEVRKFQIDMINAIANRLLADDLVTFSVEKGKDAVVISASLQINTQSHE